MSVRALLRVSRRFVRAVAAAVVVPAGAAAAVTVDWGGWAEVVVHGGTVPAMGLLEPDDRFIVAPRAAFLGRAVFSPRVDAVVLVQADRGFDPGTAVAEVRVDEVFVNWRPVDGGRLVVRAGAFATAFGGWVRRHLPADNPLVGAPLAYEWVTSAGDGAGGGNAAAPIAGVAGRRNVPDRRDLWLPVVWGPSYASGVRASGRAGDASWAVEVKNASLSSRPYDWPAWERAWSAPTVTARVAWRPGPAWEAGASASVGSYLWRGVEALPGGGDPDERHQRVAGVDAAWAAGRWEVWAELIRAEWSAPGAGVLGLWSGFVEARWRAGDGTWLAGRVSGQRHDRRDLGGWTGPWDEDVVRAEVAVGRRWTRSWTTKLQVDAADQDGAARQARLHAAVQVVARW